MFRTRNLDVEVERTQEYSQKNEAPTRYREEVFPLNPMKESQQHEFTMLRGDTNQNGKRNPIMHIRGKNDRNISKKKVRLEKLEEVPKGTLQKEGLKKLNFARILEQHNMALRNGEVI
jgi:hypothetical protein